MISNQESSNIESTETAPKKRWSRDMTYLAIKGGSLLVMTGLMTPIIMNAVQSENKVVTLRQHLAPKVADDGFTLQGIGESILPPEGWRKTLGQVVIGKVELQPDCAIDRVTIDYTGTPDAVEDAAHYHFTNYMGGTIEEKNDYQLHREVVTQTGATHHDYDFGSRAEFEAQLGSTPCQELAKQVNESSQRTQVDLK